MLSFTERRICGGVIAALAACLATGMAVSAVGGQLGTVPERPSGVRSGLPEVKSRAPRRDTISCLRWRLLVDPQLVYWIDAKNTRPYGTGIRFVLSSGTVKKTVLSYSESEDLVSMFPIGSDLLASISASGNSLWVRVFRMAPTGVFLVFNRVGRYEPDFIWPPDGASQAQVILLYSGRVMKGNSILPTISEIYRWNGSKFQRIETVSYDERFAALQKLAGAAGEKR